MAEGGVERRRRRRRKKRGRGGEGGSVGRKRGEEVGVVMVVKEEIEMKVQEEGWEVTLVRSRGEGIGEGREGVRKGRVGRCG